MHAQWKNKSMLHKHYKKYVYRKNLERIYNKEKNS